MRFEDLNKLVKYHLERTPHMLLSDVIKLLYQTEFGSEYIVFNEGQSYDSIKNEIQTMSEYARSCSVVEYLGNNYVRIYLSVFFKSDLEVNTLSRFLLISFKSHASDFSSFDYNLQGIIDLIRNGVLPFNEHEVAESLNHYRARGYPPIRHSLLYKTMYLPSYRVVNRAFGELLELFCQIDGLMKKQSRVIVAIDGASGSGKSALAKLLKAVYLCNIVSMDDFFLQKHQRTPERIAEAGGFVDYERFIKEVKGPLANGLNFAYSCYDCDREELSMPIRVTPTKLTIVEGSYSLHPTIADMYDIKVFLKVSGKQQAERLMKRNERKYMMFLKEWQAHENKFFKAFQIEENADFSYDTSEIDLRLFGRNDN